MGRNSRRRQAANLGIMGFQYCGQQQAQTGFLAEPGTKAVVPYTQQDLSKIGVSGANAGSTTGSTQNMNHKPTGTGYSWSGSTWSNKKPDLPTLLFTPYSWAKLTWMRDHGTTEVGGFFLFDGPYSFVVNDLLMIPQVCNAAHVEFDDMGLALLYDDMFDKKIDMKQFKGFWWHTHPGDSANPSGTDESTFQSKFGECEMAMMFILARGGATTCRLRINVGPGMAAEIPVRIDYSKPFSGSNFDGWKEEYDRCIKTSWSSVGPTNTPTTSATHQTHLTKKSVIDDDTDLYSEHWASRATQGSQNVPVGPKLPVVGDRRYLDDSFYDQYIFGGV